MQDVSVRHVIGAAQMLAFPKPKTPRDKRYKAWIERQPCCLNGRKVPCMGDVIGHHSETGGVSLKGSDYSMVPVCHAHHKLMDAAGKKGRGIWTEEELAAIIAYNIAEYVARGGKIKEG